MKTIARKKYDECDKCIRDNNQSILEYKKKINTLENENNKKNLEKRNYGLDIFSNKNYRKKLIKIGIKAGYSPKIIEELQSINNEWTQDSVTIDHINEFILLEKYLKEHSLLKDNLFYSFGNFFNSNEDIETDNNVAKDYDNEEE